MIAAQATVRVARHLGGGRFELGEGPLEPGPGELLVETLMTGICGTDLGITADPPEYPSSTDVLGHEAVGVVRSPGALQDTTVVLDPSLYCGVCPACRRHQPTQCWSFAGIGIERPGGFAEAFTAPPDRLLPIDPAVALESAALVEPLACVLHGLSRVAIPPSDAVVVVLGGGPIGTMFALMLERGYGCRVLVSEPAEARRKHVGSRLRGGAAVTPETIAAAVEEASNGMGAGLVIDAVGSLLPTAVALSARRGCVLSFGLAKRSVDVAFQQDLTRREVSVVPAFTAAGAFPEAIDAIERGRIAAEDLVTGVYPLARIDEAFAAARSGSGQKVLVDPRPGAR